MSEAQANKDDEFVFIEDETIKDICKEIPEPDESEETLPLKPNVETVKELSQNIDKSQISDTATNQCEGEVNTKLAKENSHPRDFCIYFDEGPHVYTIVHDGKADSDYMSVTTFNHSHFEHFDPDKIIEKMMKGKNWKNSKYYGMTPEQIKQQWEDKGKDARESGTKMHYDIECFYNGHEVKNDSIEFKYFMQFHNDTSFLTPYRTEWMIWDEELKISGSIDMVYENEDGTLSLVDWKRSREIKKENKFQKATTSCINYLPDCNFWHYSLQLNTYKAIIERKYEKQVTGMFLVCLHPENVDETYQIYEVGNMQKEVSKLFELRLSQVQKEKRKNKAK